MARATIYAHFNNKKEKRGTFDTVSLTFYRHETPLVKFWWGMGIPLEVTVVDELELLQCRNLRFQLRDGTVIVTTLENYKICSIIDVKGQAGDKRPQYFFDYEHQEEHQQKFKNKKEAEIQQLSLL